MSADNKNKLLRNIPSVDEILRKAEVQELYPRFSRALVTKAVQIILEERRQRISAMAENGIFDQGALRDVTAHHVTDMISALMLPSLKRVINATGIIVHTNLGRAPLSEEAVAAVVEAARYYSNLEFDLEGNSRGSRSNHVERLLQDLTGAESGFVVNNNAAAVLLCLSTIARGREVIISRGELIEIGGSFRIPEIMAQSGARLVEVGTTNRTHIRDYQEAITEQTAVILKAHTSNYRVVGFTAEVDPEALCRLGGEHGIPVMLDMGSGNLVSAQSLGLRDEPRVQDAVKSGIAIVTFSGDKLLGGPQAGIIVGEKKHIQAFRKNPLARALRIDKMTLAALEATLRTYLLQPEHIDAIPVMRMLMTADTVLKKRAQRVVRLASRQVPTLDISAIKDTSQVGGGAYPLHSLPTWAVAVQPSSMTVIEFENVLRRGVPPIIARISRDRVLFDMRTVFHEEIPVLAARISACALQV